MGIGAFDDAYLVGATGATVTSSGTSASVAIPNNAAGVRARVVRLQCTGNVYVKFTSGAGTCTNQDMLLSPNYDVMVHCKNFDTISYLQETASAKLNITPMEV